MYVSSACAACQPLPPGDWSCGQQGRTSLPPRTPPCKGAEKCKRALVPLPSSVHAGRGLVKRGFGHTLQCLPPLPLASAAFGATAASRLNAQSVRTLARCSMHARSLHVARLSLPAGEHYNTIPRAGLNRNEPKGPARAGKTHPAAASVGPLLTGPLRGPPPHCYCHRAPRGRTVGAVHQCRWRQCHFGCPGPDTGTARHGHPAVHPPGVGANKCRAVPVRARVDLGEGDRGRFLPTSGLLLLLWETTHRHARPLAPSPARAFGVRLALPLARAARPC